MFERESESAMNQNEFLPFPELPMVPITTSARHCQRGKLKAYALDVRFQSITRYICAHSLTQHDSVAFRNLSSSTHKRPSKLHMQSRPNRIAENLLKVTASTQSSAIMAVNFFPLQRIHLRNPFFVNASQQDIPASNAFSSPE